MRKPLWMTDKSREKCEISSCNNTSEIGFGTCFTHRIIAFHEAKGYDFNWVLKKQSEESSQNALNHTQNKLGLSSKKN